MSRKLLAALLGLAAWIAGARSHAATGCDGPAACCGAISDQKIPAPQTVSLGLAIQGIHNLDEKAGGWDVDYYLYEKWVPLPGFTPQTEIVNETSRQDSLHFDLVELKGGYCERSRHLRSTLRVDYDLRRFPFDHQNLVLIVSDAQFDVGQLIYADKPTVADIDDHVRSQLSGWRVGQAVSYARETRKFTGEEGSPRYDYATFSLPVERQIAFSPREVFSTPVDHRRRRILCVLDRSRRSQYAGVNRRYMSSCRDRAPVFRVEPPARGRLPNPC